MILARALEIENILEKMKVLINLQILEWHIFSLVFLMGVELDSMFLWIPFGAVQEISTK